MKLLLLLLAVMLLLFLSVGSYCLVRWLKRLAASPEMRAFGESCDGGLAIPMRDCDTRTTLWLTTRSAELCMLAQGIAAATTAPASCCTQTFAQAGPGGGEYCL